MNQICKIVPFDPAHEAQVVDLWTRVFGYDAPHNAPLLAIRKKQSHADGMFYVALDNMKKVVGTVMCGYDGHRGWIYSLAVTHELQRSGIGRQLMHHAEEVLRQAGCMKINLQVVEGNDGAIRFYETLGFSTEKRISMGKKLPENVSVP